MRSTRLTGVVTYSCIPSGNSMTTTEPLRGAVTSRPATARARFARQRVVLFKPRVDNRYDEVKVVTHEGLGADAVPVADAGELLARVPFGAAVIGVDEVQFFGDDIVAAAESLANAGARVIV